MKKLIITAHPSTQGFTHEISKKLIDASQNNNHDTKLLNLYEDKNFSDFMRYENITETTNFSQTEEVKKLLKWADEYIFVFPVWWYDSPAILKNFFDMTFSAGFAYKYKKGSSLPEKLLKGKSARFFCTSDGPAWIYHLHILPLKRAWKWRLSFCGVKIKSFTIFGLKKKSTKSIQEKWLQKVGEIMTK